MVKRLAKWLMRNQRGNTTMIIGLSLFPVIGAIGLGVDAAQWVLWKRQLHSSADLAALAGARALSDNQNVNTAVRRSLSYNDMRAFTVEAIENGPTSGPFSGSSAHVRVVLSTQSSLPFSSLFLTQAPTIRVEATAQNSSEVPQCVLALDQSNTTALTITGSATVTMNCGMASNALGSASLQADGGWVDVPALSAVGSVIGSSYDSSVTKINTGISAVSDPYSGLSMPTDVATQCAGATFVSVRRNASQTINPGCYTGISVQGTLTMNPGTYIIDGGDVAVGSSAKLFGDGVTILYTNSDPSSSTIGRFIGTGTGVVQLTASSSGDYKGILMYQDRRAVPANGTNFYILGNQGTDNAGNTILSKFQGAIYTPSTYATFNGNSSIQTPCMQVVAKRVNFTGNTTVQNSCPPGSGASAFGGSGSVVRLVG